MLQRVMPELLIHDIIGIQPMSGPSDSVSFQEIDENTKRLWKEQALRETLEEHEQIPAL